MSNNDMARPEIWGLGRLKPYARNMRLHPQSQIDVIKKSIQEFGFINPIIVRGNGEIVAGHGRLEAITQLGLDRVPVLIVDYLTEDQVRAYRIADNQIAMLGSWDEELLKFEVSALNESNFDLDLLGFASEELDDLISALDDLGDQDDADTGEEDEEPFEATFEGDAISQEGEIYWLGDHRLACGSSLDEDVWKRLMGSEKADMCFTDPPYGVAYKGGSRARVEIADDDLGVDDLTTFLRPVFTHIHSALKAGGAMYVSCPDSEIGMPFRTVLMELKMWRHNLVWVKDTSTFGRSDYHYQHESVLYGWKEGAGHYFTDDRTQTTVLAFKRPTKSDAHPTMKPIDLLRTLILNSSRRGEIVIDGFGGSGSTLIAAASVGRKSRLVELQPHYCDLIRRRWARFALKHGLEIGDGIVDEKNTGTDAFDGEFSDKGDEFSNRDSGTNEFVREKLAGKMR